MEEYQDTLKGEKKAMWERKGKPCGKNSLEWYLPITNSLCPSDGMNLLITDQVTDSSSLLYEQSQCPVPTVVTSEEDSREDHLWG